MTIREIASKYGYLVHCTSVNDDLTKIVRAIYQSDNVLYRKIITTLNKRLDWMCVEPNTYIKYIDKSFCKEINEIDS